MCTGAEIGALALSAAGTGAGVVAQNQARARQDHEAAAGIIRQAELSRQANQKVQKNIQQVEQDDPNEDIAKRQATYMDALRRSQPTTNQALPAVAGGSHRFAEDVTGAQDASTGEAATSAGLMARIDAPSIRLEREGQAANNTLSELSLLGDKSAHQDYLTRLRASMAQPNPWLTGAGALAKGYGSAAAINGAYSDDEIPVVTPKKRGRIPGQYSPIFDGGVNS